MGNMMVFKMIFVAIFIVAGIIAVGLSYLLFRVAKAKSKKLWVRFFSIIPIIVFACFCYRAVIPGDAFFQKQFTQTTGLDFPQTGEIIYKNVSEADEFGDATYISIATVGVDIYNQVIKSITAKGFAIEASPMDFNEELPNLDEVEIVEEYMLNEKGNYQTVALLSDSISVLIINRYY